VDLRHLTADRPSSLPPTDGRSPWTSCSALDKPLERLVGVMRTQRERHEATSNPKTGEACNCACCGLFFLSRTQRKKKEWPGLDRQANSRRGKKEVRQYGPTIQCTEWWIRCVMGNCNVTVTYFCNIACRKRSAAAWGFTPPCAAMTGFPSDKAHSGCNNLSPAVLRPHPQKRRREMKSNRRLC
jgi:hypothetical protein